MRLPPLVLRISLLFAVMTAYRLPPASRDAGDRDAPDKGHEYYFSHEGDDSADGSREHPFATIKKCNSLKLQPGDVVFFRGGDRFEGGLRIAESGAPEQLIVFTSYGTGRATIMAGDSSAIVMEDCGFVSLVGLDCKGSGRKTGNTMAGISVSHGRYNQVTDMDISGFQKSGLLVYRSEDIVVKRVFAHDNGAAGIEISGDGDKSSCRNIVVSGCRAENNPGDPTNLTNHSGNGIVAGYCRNVAIQHCSASNNGWDMPRKGNGPVGIWCFESDTVIIEHCVSYRNKTSVGGGDGGGFDFDGGVTHSVMQYNLSYENQGAGYCLFQYAGASPWHDNLVRYNISENDGQVSEAGGSVFIWNSSGEGDQFYNAAVQNNTIINQRGPAISYSALSRRKGFVFSNNIFVSDREAVKGLPGNDRFSGNDWWNLANVPSNLPGKKLKPGFAFPAMHKPETADSLSAFPGYTLPPASPLYSGGVPTTVFFGFTASSVDFNGNTAADRGIGAAFGKR